MKASDYIAWALEQHGVTCVFEMSGGMITHILDSLNRQGTVPVISVHHEQAAAFAADAAGRMTGIPGVAMATSGPGATNLLTGIGSCHFDSSPGVFITGQVNLHEQKGDRAIRQLGFQETDIVAMAEPITKQAWRVKTAAELPAILNEAFRVAVEGRPGPVLIDVPMDLQRAQVEAVPPLPKRLTEAPESETFFENLAAALRTARRPLILAGGGVGASRTSSELVAFAEATGVPVVCSLMGLDTIPFEHPLRIGFIGSYGNRWANLALGEADLLIVLGSRLDIRQTGNDTDAFKSNREIFHVDCEPGEINNRLSGCQGLVSELPDFFRAATGRLPHGVFADWRNRLQALEQEWPDTAELKDLPGINPNVFMRELSVSGAQVAAYVVDVGQHQMWAAQSLHLQAGQRFLTSGGMGSMGFALPAAIGASLCRPGQPVVMIAGDGAFQANIQELQTVVRNRLPLKMVIINNQCHGMVRQFQENYFDARYQSTLWGYSAPDFEKIAGAYGIAGYTVHQPEDVAEGLRKLWQDPLAPGLLQVMVDTYANAYPKIAFGRPMTEMEPFFKSVAMEST
ncbi:MAG: thiamine pyrophosphate-binding protein [Candidatus Eremiobacteraeota bacterium]|nr:thiamine pyrophosphate-binding protein [Candidatus Eremiobacteraeota bacterium]